MEDNSKKLSALQNEKEKLLKELTALATELASHKADLIRIKKSELDSDQRDVIQELVNQQTSESDRLRKSLDSVNAEMRQIKNMDHLKNFENLFEGAVSKYQSVKNEANKKVALSIYDRLMKIIEELELDIIKYSFNEERLNKIEKTKKKITNLFNKLRE